MKTNKPTSPKGSPIKIIKNYSSGRMQTPYLINLFLQNEFSHFYLKPLLFKLKRKEKAKIIAIIDQYLSFQYDQTKGKTFLRKAIKKQPPEVFYKNKCSEKFPKIHRKAPVPESVF